VDIIALKDNNTTALKDNNRTLKNKISKNSLRM
jgi:hypothetical protein